MMEIYVRDDHQNNILAGNNPISTWEGNCIECGGDLRNGHQGGCSLAPKPGDTVCPHCGGVKVKGTKCRGNDECNEGPNGEAVEWCQGWGPYCCRCGTSYAVGQL